MHISPAREAALVESREQWDRLSSAWLRWQDIFERGGAAVTTRLMELAELSPGQRVLDVGTGLGEPALTVAEEVGPTGSVVGIDVSPAMIGLARQRAAGSSTLEFLDTDPLRFETDRRFDAVLSRWCLMLVPERDATLRALRALLVPGGVLVAAVWGPAVKAPMMSLAFTVLGPLLQLGPPAPDQPGPYAMADAQQCRTELTAAGFGPVSVVAVEAPFWFDSPEDYADFSLDVLPPGLRQLLHERLGSTDVSSVRQQIAAKAADFVSDGRVQLTSRTFCVRGVTP
ncbi:MAG TPA: methyltransferase domain-containing protein [Jatrophihabitans sp.]|nr:methyltransferase domain-containing protein [Jatrophihabitans sp.]